MKSLYFVLLLTICAVNSLSGQSDHLRVLFLGNSYTSSNNLPSLVEDVASAYGDSLTYQAITPGGQYLKAHATDNSVQSAIQQGGWDVILMQEQSQIPVIPHYRETLFMPGADSLKKLRDQYAPSAKLRLFLTWGRENGGQQCNNGYCSVPFTDFGHYQDTLTWAYQRAADSNNAAIAPVGEMWREAYASHDSTMAPLDLFSSDGSHPAIQGSYLAALTVYSTLFEVPTLPGYSPQVTNVDPSIDSLFRSIVDDHVWPRHAEWRLCNNTLNRQVTVSADTLEAQAEEASLQWLDCSNNFAPIPGDTDRTFIANNPGSYAVRIDRLVCRDTSACITTSALNIGSGTETSRTRLFPNPTSNVITLEWGAPRTGSILIKNSAGHLVQRKVVQNARKVRFSLENRPKGLYFLNLRTEKKNEVLKVLKK